MATSDPFLPSRPGERAEDIPAEPTEVELEEDRGETPDPAGDGPTDEGLPPLPSTPFQRPDGDAVDPSTL